MCGRIAAYGIAGLDRSRSARETYTPALV